MSETTLDHHYYRSIHPDLSQMSDGELELHYRTYGAKEGRIPSALALRSGFLASIATEAASLEIGPFCSPCLRGEGVSYFDIMSGAELRTRARSLGLDPNRVPDIDHVSPEGDLSIVRRKFRRVLSSHCVEHQPDLVRHLNQVAELLEGRGRYYLIIPDKRFCFDHFIATTTIADVLDAHFDRRRRHTLKSVIEHRALTTHNDAGRHWTGDHSNDDYFGSRISRTRSAIAEYSARPRSYIDVHAWQFTPNSFCDIMNNLFELGFSRLRPVEVYGTPYGNLEFTAVMEVAVA